MQHRTVCIFIVTDELTTPLEDFVFTSSLTSPKPVKRASVWIYVPGVAARFKQPPILRGAKNTHLYKSLLSRFQLPYPLLKMSFAAFPRSAYAGGTAILPVERVDRDNVRDWARISLFILSLVILLGSWFYCWTLKTLHFCHYLRPDRDTEDTCCNCFPKSFVIDLSNIIKLWVLQYTLTIVQ